MKSWKYVILLLMIASMLASSSAALSQSAMKVRDESPVYLQTDVSDILHSILNKKLNREERDSARLKKNGPSISAIPAFGYGIATGLTGLIATSTTFFTDKERKRRSSVLLNGYYSVNKQYWFTAISNIFLDKQKLRIFSDTRYYEFPTQTYGLGAYTPLSNPLQIDYSYLRFYQILLRQVRDNFYLGIGYCLDKHWNIEVDSIPGKALEQFVKYQKGNHSTSSGISLSVMYDSRKSTVNPRNGYYANIQFRPKMTILGSDRNWQSLIIEVRHYIKLSHSSRNVLALWSYNNISLSGTPPYLDMPSIGWDNYSNTGRGYAPGRYTGRNILYLESELRYSITRNGLLGGVIFANGQSVNEKISDACRKIIPGGGMGLRVKLNKLSDTNVGVDYGLGIRGSHGLFFNIGEVF